MQFPAKNSFPKDKGLHTRFISLPGPIFHRDPGKGRKEQGAQPQRF